MEIGSDDAFGNNILSFVDDSGVTMFPQRSERKGEMRLLAEMRLMIERHQRACIRTVNQVAPREEKGSSCL